MHSGIVTEAASLGSGKRRRIMISELLFADDRVFIAYSQKDLQVMVDDFARTSIRYGLNMSIKKTEVIPNNQP